MQNWRDSGQEGCKKGGIPDMWNTRLEGCWKEGMQERRDAGNERHRKGAMQERIVSRGNECMKEGMQEGQGCGTGFRNFFAYEVLFVKLNSR